MKTTTKTSIPALLLLLAISCKKENNSIQTNSVADKSFDQNIWTDDQILAGDTVRIGTQLWMSKNLHVTHYRNGDHIPYVFGRDKWAALTTGAYCWNKNDSANGAVYGNLYNWYAVNDPRGLAPVGWHIPSRAEWETLDSFLGGRTRVGGKLKEAGTAHWIAPNVGANNKSGFTALPAGYRLYNGMFSFLYIRNYLWSTTEYNSINAWVRILQYDDNYFGDTYSNKQDGFSVRCLKDE